MNIDYEPHDFDNRIRDALRADACRAPGASDGAPEWDSRPLATVSAGGDRRTSEGRHRNLGAAVAASVALVVAASVLAALDGPGLRRAGLSTATSAPGDSTRSTTAAATGVIDLGSPPPAAIDPYLLLSLDGGMEAIAVAKEAIEVLITDCMTANGFAYIAPQHSVGQAEPVWKDRAYRKRYGYGLPPVAADVTDWDAFNAQFDDAAFTIALQGSDPDAQMGGCTLDAYTTLYPPDGVAVPPRLKEWNAAVDEFLNTRVWGSGDTLPDPQLAAVALKWSACMSEHGVDAGTSPFDLQNAARVERYERGSVDLTGAPTSGEVALALLDLDCQLATGFATDWTERVMELVEGFSNEHGELRSSIVAFYATVAHRSNVIKSGR